jgi:hypothetical protein
MISKVEAQMDPFGVKVIWTTGAWRRIRTLGI